MINLRMIPLDLYKDSEPFGQILRHQGFEWQDPTQSAHSANSERRPFWGSGGTGRIYLGGEAINGASFSGSYCATGVDASTSHT